MSLFQERIQPVLRKLEQREARLKQLEQSIGTMLEGIESQWLSGRILLDDLILLLALNRVDKTKLQNSRAYLTENERDTNIIPRIKKAITTEQLFIYDEHGDCRENDFVIQHDKFPFKAVVFIEDFIKWQSRTKLVAMPAMLRDIALDKPQPIKLQSIPKEKYEALKLLLGEIEQRAISHKIPFDINRMFGTKKQLHCLAKVHFDGRIFEKSLFTFSDYLKNGKLCKIPRGQKQTPFYSTLFPEYADSMKAMMLAGEKAKSPNLP